MTPNRRVRDRGVIRMVAPLLLIGLGAGAVILGLGGRVAMRIIALANGSPAVLSLGGTITVVLAGAASGLGGVLLHFVATGITRWIAPQQRWVRRVLFAIFLLGISLRGLHPVQPFPLALFLPLVVLYGVLIDIVATRRATRVESPPAIAIPA